VGETVGFSIRLENVTGARTLIRFVTEEKLSCRVMRDSLLAGTSVIIPDEFHKRHLNTDPALAFLR
jgi:ATP-dependent helicase HrpB